MARRFSEGVRTSLTSWNRCGRLSDSNRAAGQTTSETFRRDSFQETVISLNSVLPGSSLRKPDVTFWSVWVGDEIAGGGALKRLDERRAEIKSMRVSDKCLGQRRGKGLTQPPDR
jgi:hypothetical protein